jgi:hypothetical protein
LVAAFFEAVALDLGAAVSLGEWDSGVGVAAEAVVFSGWVVVFPVLAALAVVGGISVMLFCVEPGF